MPYIALDESTAEDAPAVTIGAPLTSVGMTFGEMLAELDAELGSRTDVDNTSVRLKLWVNWAYRNVASMLTVKELMGSFSLTTVADQPFYLLPTSIAWLKRLSIIDATDFLAGGQEMEMIDESGYRLLADLTDIPSKYMRYRRMLVLWATPNDEYELTVDCRVRPDNMVDSTDSPILPEEFHESILLYGRYRAFRALRMYQEASVALNDAVTTLRPLINTDAEEADGAIQRVQPIRTKAQLFRGRY